MKKFLLSILALCLASTAAMAQTSDAVKASTGLYTGDLYISLGEPIDDKTEVTGQQTVELTADGASTIQFALRNFAFGDLQLGDIIIPAIEVALQNSKVSFGEKEALRMTLGKGETAIDCAVKILSTSSQIENNKLVVNLDITWFFGEEQTPIYVRFVGDKVEASAAVKASVGDYNGDLYVSFDPINEETEVTGQYKVELTAAGANSINFALRNFSFGDLQLGDIVIPNMPVSMNGTKVTFGDMEPLHMLLGEGETAIDCSVKVDPATSYVENHVLFVNLDIVWFMGEDQTPIYVRFNSSKWVGLQHVSIAKKTGRIYSIDGRYAGNSLQGLSRGIYVQDGKKIYVK